MSEKTICTVEELKNYLSSHLSCKRYEHCLGVAETTSKILEHYKCRRHETYSGFEASVFCGLTHDIAREFSDEQIFNYCKENDIYLDEEERLFPVLAHGKVSASVAHKLCGNFPESWSKAICEHTTGDSDMDEISLALFCADYLEPSRKYMTDDRRREYLNSVSLEECAYRILCDMMKHWKEKGHHISCSKSIAMKSWLEEKI